MKTTIISALLLNVLVGSVSGSSLRGSEIAAAAGDDQQRFLGGSAAFHSITDSTALYEGQTVTCTDHEERVYRWSNGQLRGYPSVKIADSWNIRWRPEMAHVDCQHLPIGENMPLKINEPVDDGTIVTCFGHEEKVYMMDNGALRWFPHPSIVSSYEEHWQAAMVVVYCEAFPFGPDMEMKEVDGDAVDVVADVDMDADVDADVNDVPPPPPEEGEPIFPTETEAETATELPEEHHSGFNLFKLIFG